MTEKDHKQPDKFKKALIHMWSWVTSLFQFFHKEKNLILVATLVIAAANWFTYQQIKNDNQIRTRPYIQIDYKPQEGHAYIKNYGQIFACDVELLMSYSSKEGWVDVGGGVRNMVLMPGEQRASESKIDFISLKQAVQEEMKSPNMTNKMIVQVLGIERIRFICNYYGPGRKVKYVTRRIFSIEAKDDNASFIPILSQDDYAE